VESAAAADREAEQLARDLLGTAVTGNNLRSAVKDLARGVVSRGTWRQSWEPVPTSAWHAATTARGASVETTPTPERDTTAAWLTAERAEAHRLELERLERARIEATRSEAERAAAERAAAERAAEERAQAENAARAAEERRLAAEEAERLERRRRREQRLEEHRLEVERREAERREAERLEAERQAAQDDELAVALSQWREARSHGDRRAARAANEKVVDLLRPRAEADLVTYGSQLVDALEELSRVRLRSGDVWGSHAPAKEARALARALNR
jgi:hypothetical protein